MLFPKWTFAELMNQTAERLGLSDSHFTNPHGLDDEEHYTTAHDLARIAAYAMKNEEYKKITAMRSSVSLFLYALLEKSRQI